MSNLFKTLFYIMLHIVEFTQRLQKLIFLYLSTGCFGEFSLLSSGLSTDDFLTVLNQFLVELCR